MGEVLRHVVRGPVRGVVVDVDHLELIGGHILVEQRADGGIEVATTVVAEHDDAGSNPSGGVRHQSGRRVRSDGRERARASSAPADPCTSSASACRSICAPKMMGTTAIMTVPAVAT